METPADKPWLLLARRPASLAALLQFDEEQAREGRSHVDSERLDEAQPAGADSAPPSDPPTTGD